LNAIKYFQVVATHLPPEEIEGIRQMFMDMDTDGSGTISFEELREGESIRHKILSSDEYLK
jgi:calcium-dependent protein kinase